MNCTMSISPLNLSPYNSIWTWLIPFISTDLFSYLGAGYQLPKVQAESLVLIDSKVKLDPFTFRVHVDEPSLTFKVKLINSNVTWKLIFFLQTLLKLFFVLSHVGMYSKTFFIQLQFLWKLYYYLYVLPKKLHSPWNSLVLCEWI